MNHSSHFVKIFNTMKILFILSLVGFANVFAAATTYQAESATVFGARVVGSYVDYINNSGDYVEWNVNASAAGVYDLDFRYALLKDNRPLEIRINGVVVNARLAFIVTGGWSTYKTIRITKSLLRGVNKIRAVAIGASGPNMDCLIVTPSAGAPTQIGRAHV